MPKNQQQTNPAADLIAVINLYMMQTENPFFITKASDNHRSMVIALLLS